MGLLDLLGSHEVWVRGCLNWSAEINGIEREIQGAQAALGEQAASKVEKKAGSGADDVTHKVDTSSRGR